MKKRVLTSVAASAVVLGTLVLSGCGGSSDNGSNPGTQGPGNGNGNSAEIRIETGSGTVAVDPATGGVVAVNRNNNSSAGGSNYTPTAVVVPSPGLNECANATSDSDGDGIICGPKAGVTYIFQSDFGKLGGPTGNGDSDGNASTPDGGVLLYDALTKYNGQTFDTPVDPNLGENRIQEVYIPANYIKTTDDFSNKSTDEQYNAMRAYLANVCNMQCFAAENNETDSFNPYFTDGKEKGKFVATYVMHFTRGTGEAALMEKFKTDKTDLEYLTVSFELDVERVDQNSSKLRFSVPANTPVTFGAKKHGEGALYVETTNIDLNSIVHQTVDADHALTINMAKYFDKLIAKGEAQGVADFAKAILVENAQHPWPVKIYGTLHEMKDDGTFERSFVRNPGKLDGDLFGLTTSGAYKDAFNNDPEHKAKAEKFNIVYPGGDYNKLED